MVRGDKSNKRVYISEISNIFHKWKTTPHRYDTKDHTCGNVEEWASKILLLQKGHIFQGKGWKGSEATAEPYSQKQTDGIWKFQFAQKQAIYNPKDEASNNIHRKGTERNDFAGTFVNKARQGKACCATKKASDTYQ